MILFYNIVHQMQKSGGAMVHCFNLVDIVADVASVRPPLQRLYTPTSGHWLYHQGYEGIHIEVRSVKTSDSINSMVASVQESSS